MSERDAVTSVEPGCACGGMAACPQCQERDALRALLDDERAARRVAADAADRFRDVLSECLGHPDENPGDDVLVAELRDHFGRTGPEPTGWRDFIAGALAQVDQINAERRVKRRVIRPEGNRR
jgi:hypothetical protein